VSLPAAPLTVRVLMKYQTEGLPMANVSYVLCPSAASAADLTTIAGVFQAWWTTEHRTALSVSTTWIGADLTALDAPGSPFLTYNNSGPGTGVFSGGCYPPNVSLAISLKTGLSGRSFRGRLYMPGVSTVAPIVGGLHIPASIAFWQPLYDALRTRLITAGFHWCVTSFYSGMTPTHERIPRAVAVSTPVTAVQIGRRSDSQRGRLPVGA
jgi:hypothetical protein